MVRTQVQLTEEQAKVVRRLAKRNRISQAEVIRRAVDRVAHSEVLPDWEEIKRRALAAAGTGHADVTDLSTRHDDYLADAYSE